MLFQVFQQTTPQGFIATGYQGRVDTGLTQPVLGGAAAQAATKTIEIAVGVRPPPVVPGAQTALLDLATDQLIAEINGRLLPLLLITQTDQMTFLVVDQRKVGGMGKRASGEFHRGADIQERRVVQ